MNHFKEQLYAIVDIETTGSFAAGCRITEIAVFISNGKQIIEKFQSLVNPQMPIPLGIQSLTGITDELVKSAPLFEEIAPEVMRLLHGKIFVAHNVNFDYSFVRHQLLQAGLEWKASKLCTVRLARKIFPGQASYSLGKLCQSLGIPLDNRHRAAGDAEATTTLFHLLQLQDEQQFIQAALKQTSKEQRLPNHVSAEDFEQLPATAGIYIFKDRVGKIIYIGKAIDLRKRVLTHFTGNNIGLRRQQFLQEIYYIEHQESGTELMALLMECQLIKKHWPKYNRALKRFEPKFGLIQYQDLAGYNRLAVIKTPKNSPCIQYFDRATDANQFLIKLIDSYQLHPFLCQFFIDRTSDKVNRQQQLQQLQIADKEQYNKQVDQAIKSLEDHRSSYIIIDQGRNTAEKSYLYIKDNRMYAMGFVDQLAEIADPEDLINKGDYCSSNYYMMQLVENHIERFPQRVQHIAKQFA
ncbi:GIY-YIG nuclease family protein [Sphingobacteriaceae bacterium WQ 2009]|uniref:GIY-YIG nuclease family protein n=1 Tax=Rhinopithecimicrobium faecis TaxID=2820698 RepID=A0A8T4HCC0_9SPHI|nr:GIY-YIG nuclease family protein [Sphingobacteriaceae bacterium WQ 2009]